MAELERIETSIFRQNTEKTIVSAIMNPRVRGGLGEIMFDVARDLTKEMWNFRYTGRCLMLDSIYSKTISLSDESLSVSLDTCFYVFGGCAYQVHATKDKSRFAHILPGLHDVDIRGAVEVKSTNHWIVQPFERDSIDHHIDGNAFDLRAEGVLPYVARKIFATIRSRLQRSKGPINYYRRTTDSIDEVRVMDASRSPKYVYQEVVNDIFLVGIVDEGSMFKVQIDVTGKLGDVIGTDHVLEIVFPVIDDCPEPRCPKDMVRIDGVFVESKQKLFFENMKSAIERSYHGEATPWLSDRHLFFGKCAQDVLRLAYIILTDLDSRRSWVNTAMMDYTFYALPDNLKQILTEHRRVSDALHRQTPIEYFTQYMKHLAPCIERSEVGKFRLHSEDIVDFKKNHGAPIFLKEILEIFENFTEEIKKRNLDDLSDHVKETGVTRNRAIGKGPYDLQAWENMVRLRDEHRAARNLRRREPGADVLQSHSPVNPHLL